MRHSLLTLRKPTSLIALRLAVCRRDYRKKRILVVKSPHNYLLSLPPPSFLSPLLPLLLTYFISASLMLTSFLRETYSSPAPLSSSTDVPVITSKT